jgi:hypothetical protein
MEIFRDFELNDDWRFVIYPGDFQVESAMKANVFKPHVKQHFYTPQAANNENKMSDNLLETMNEYTNTNLVSDRIINCKEKDSTDEILECIINEFFSQLRSDNVCVINAPPAPTPNYEFNYGLLSPTLSFDLPKSTSTEFNVFSPISPCSPKHSKNYNQRDFECLECSKRFSRKHDLKRHGRIHERKRLFGFR